MRPKYGLRKSKDSNFARLEHDNVISFAEREHVLDGEDVKVTGLYFKMKYFCLWYRLAAKITLAVITFYNSINSSLFTSPPTHGNR